MTRYLSLAEVLLLHQRILDATGGARGVLDRGSLESAVARPRATFDLQDLYPDTISKAAALCSALVANHPFVDGNKRVGHAAMETFLLLNGFELAAPVDEQERIMLDLAAGQLPLDRFCDWVRKHTRVRSD